MRWKSPRFPGICALLVACALAASASAIPRPALAAPKPGAAAKKKKPPPKERERVPDAAPPVERPPPAASVKEKAQPSATGDDEGRALQRGERVEFDARLVQGQTAKAGAVYLFARVGTNLRSMVKERTSFRDKIVQSVFPSGDGAREGGP
jgi:hypothetical protein